MTTRASRAAVRRGTAATAIGAALWAASGAAQADATSDRIADLERRLERSMQVIEQLSKKVDQLQAERATPAPTVAPATNPAIATRIESLEQQVSAIGSRSTVDDGLALHGFADVGLRGASDGSRRGAALGNVDFYLTPQFGSNVKSLIELVFETDDNGKIGTDLERLQLGYTFSDRLTVWLGRFHTPYGWWNTAYHHGAQIQTSILRPRFLDFEDRGGILPAHGVGAWAVGKLAAGDGKLHYDFYVDNAPRLVLDNPAAPGTGTLDPNLAGATEHNATVGGRVGYDFGGSLAGLTLGAHALATSVQDNAAAPHRTRVRMAGLYGVYQENNWELLGESYAFRDRDASGIGGTHKSWAAYLQAGRTFDRWTPYLRQERAALDQADNYFAQQASGLSYTRSVIGVRYDIDPKSALKVEINRTRYTDRVIDNVNEARAQYSIRF